MQKPKAISVGLRELIRLLNYVQAASKSELVGDGGFIDYNSLVDQVDNQSDLYVTPDQLDHMLWVYKNCIASKIAPGTERADDNWNDLMRGLHARDPDMYKILASGEIEFLNFRPEGF